MSYGGRLAILPGQSKAEEFSLLSMGPRITPIAGLCRGLTWVSDERSTNPASIVKRFVRFLLEREALEDEAAIRNLAAAFADAATRHDTAALASTCKENFTIGKRS
jgi:hypothetical protein